LHVDHVVPVAESGSDDPTNLVAACSDCNLGKSSKSLQCSGLDVPEPTAAMLDHAEQMRAYLSAVSEVRDARAELEGMAINHWCEALECALPARLTHSIAYWIEQVGLETVLSAIDIVAYRRLPSATDQTKYFLATVRNMRDDRAGTPRRGVQ